MYSKPAFWGSTLNSHMLVVFLQLFQSKIRCCILFAFPDCLYNYSQISSSSRILFFLFLHKLRNEAQLTKSTKCSSIPYLLYFTLLHYPKRMLERKQERFLIAQAATFQSIFFSNLMNYTLQCKVFQQIF